MITGGADLSSQAARTAACLVDWSHSAATGDLWVAALVARAAALGLVEPVPEEDRQFALREGWIAIPRAGSLRLLPGRRSQSVPAKEGLAG